MTEDVDFDVLNEEGDLEDDLRDSWFDTYLISAMGPLSNVVNDVVLKLNDYETTHSVRGRRRKPRDRETFLACVDCTITNITDVFLRRGCGTPIVVSRKLSKAKPYVNKLLAEKTFNGCLDLMEASGLISMIKGQRHGSRTTIASTSELEAIIIGHGVDLSCIRECPTRPCVVLRRSIKENLWDKAKRVPVAFDTTFETSLLDAQVRRLNDFLRGADISFVDDGVLNDKVNPGARSLSRYFTLRNDQDIRFDQGGRLFGRAFWLNLKSDRRQHIRIDGEPIADLDFCNLGPRIAYHLVKDVAPEGDLYDLTNHLSGYNHGNDEHRKAIKRAFASCLNGGRGGDRGRKPKDGKRGRSGILSPLPKGITAAKIRKALSEKHRPLADLFEPQKVPVGFTIMYLESCILLCALEKLMKVGVVALPVHDGVMCAVSKRRIVSEALSAASREILRVALPVEEKPVYRAPDAFKGLLAA